MISKPDNMKYSSYTFICTCDQRSKATVKFMYLSHDVMFSLNGVFLKLPHPDNRCVICYTFYCIWYLNYAGSLMAGTMKISHVYGLPCVTSQAHVSLPELEINKQYM